MKGLKRNISWFAGFWVVLLLLLPAVSAQADCEPCPFKIELTVNTLLGPDDPVTMQIRVFNNTGERLITHHGFLNQLFYKWVTIIGPDGKQIPYLFAEATDYPSPPIPYKDESWVLADIIPPMGDPGSESLIVFDAREYYNLDDISGSFTAQVRVPAEIFEQYDVTPSGAVLANLDDPARCGCNPLASNTVRFGFIPLEPVGTFAIHVIVKTITIGDGTNPTVSKAPVPRDTSVRLYRLVDIPADCYPINWKTYSKIREKVSFLRSVNTDSNGIARFENVLKSDYLVIADPRVSLDFKHLGKLILADPDWLSGVPLIKHMVIIEKLKDKKKLPGKTMKLKGSELLITEPEYVEWDSTQEVYPIVFESIGDWQIETSVTPPEGFESDYKSLDAQVDNEIEAVQFTVTDVGSEWKATKIKYKIKHNKKIKLIDSKIDIKLSKKLAKEKGMSIYGDEDKKDKDKDKE